VHSYLQRKVLGQVLSSSKKDNKAIRERKVFSFFLTEKRWPNDSSLFESREEPEPDILYRHPKDGPIAFELTELCSPEIARAISKLPAEGVSPFIRTEDPSEDILRKKLLKTYETDHPIELLCYTGGRLVTPDDSIKEHMKLVIECHEVNFRRIWLLGDKVHCLFDKMKL